MDLRTLLFKICEEDVYGFNTSIVERILRTFFIQDTFQYSKRKRKKLNFRKINDPEGIIQTLYSTIYAHCGKPVLGGARVSSSRPIKTTSSYNK